MRRCSARPGVGVIHLQHLLRPGGGTFSDPMRPCFRVTLAREPALIAEAGRRLRKVLMVEKRPEPEDRTGRSAGRLALRRQWLALACWPKNEASLGYSGVAIS